MDDAQITIYTAGHGNRTAEEFTDLLGGFGIACLVDVRRFPGSRRHPHFAREALAESLAAVRIDYHWAGETLGGRRRVAPDSPHTALRCEGFRAYADHMMTPEFSASVRHLMALAARQPMALMCAERLPWRCHRFYLSDYLCTRGARVLHLLEADKFLAHRLSPHLRLAGNRLIYDVPASGQLSLEL